jgi:hypothetical protein
MSADSALGPDMQVTLPVNLNGCCSLCLPRLHIIDITYLLFFKSFPPFVDLPVAYAYCIIMHL